GIFKKNGNSSEILKATFNPDDTNFYEFRKFIEPLFRLGALSHEDVKDMKDDTNHFSILNRLTDTLIDNSIMAQVHVLSSGENYSADVLTLEHPSENEVSKGTKDYRSDEIDEPSNNDETSTETTATTESDVIKDEPKQEPVKSENDDTSTSDEDNPFKSGAIDIDDDDLPF